MISPADTPPAPTRHTVDSLTSDALDQLYAETDRLTAELADYDQRVEQLTNELGALRKAARGYCPHCGGELRTALDEPEDSPVSVLYPAVRGRCPACRHSSLLLGVEGHILCSRPDCPDPTAANRLLNPTETPGEADEHSLYDKIAGMFGRPLPYPWPVAEPDTREEQPDA